MRADVLKQILMRISENTFAPNVAISGLLALHEGPGEERACSAYQSADRRSVH